MKRAIFSAVLASLGLVSCAFAAEWRVRARENFETGTVNLGDGAGSASYRGLLSAFDLFYEEPFKRLYGLTLHRGGASRVGRGERLTVTVLGAEAKLFPTQRARPLFVRGGLIGQAADPAGPVKESWTYGFSAGLGAEFLVWKLGLAPELGGKFLWGSRGRRVTNLYAAIGVHFYVFPGDHTREKS